MFCFTKMWYCDVLAKSDYNKYVDNLLFCGRTMKILALKSVVDQYSGLRILLHLWTNKFVTCKNIVLVLRELGILGEKLYTYSMTLFNGHRFFYYSLCFIMESFFLSMVSVCPFIIQLNCVNINFMRPVAQTTSFQAFFLNKSETIFYP